MNKRLKGRALLLAGVSAIVLGGAFPAHAQSVTWGARTPDPVSESADKSKKKAEPFTPKVTRTVVTRTVTRGGITTTTVTETLGDAPATETSHVATAAVPTEIKRETVGVSGKPADEDVAASKKQKPAKDENKRETKREKQKTAEETKDKKVEEKKNKKNDKADKIPAAVPPGPLHVIVSVDAQRASLYANGAFVTSTKVSTGTKTHPTPMGVFSVLQKNKHHVSNLYGASMPYMQRLTWSGTAMHTGPLPGYPASHGCIRLTDEFAQMLWKATKIGARVIVTRDDVKPVEIAHAQLFPPKPAMVDVAPAPEITGALVRTADAANNVPGVVMQDAPSQEPKPSAAELARRKSPVSIFISRKDGKLYVRQAMQPLFDLPITLRDGDQPIGTHVYTAMEIKDGAMRWTAVSVPSSFAPAAAEPEKTTKRGKKTPQPAVVQAPQPSPSAALDRIDMPKDALDRLAGMIVPGSSLIVSDNGISSETSRHTDFIVLTR